MWTVWETFKSLSSYIQNTTIKCEKIGDKMWVRHWKSHGLVALIFSLHLNGINEPYEHMVKDFFGWCDSHFKVAHCPRLFCVFLLFVHLKKYSLNYLAVL